MKSLSASQFYFPPLHGLEQLEQAGVGYFPSPGEFGSNKNSSSTGSDSFSLEDTDLVRAEFSGVFSFPDGIRRGSFSPFF